MISLMAIICKRRFIDYQKQKQEELNQKKENSKLDTFSRSMWRRSLISLKVRLASMMLLKALPIFFMATSSCVSQLTAALRSEKEQTVRRILKYKREEKGKRFVKAQIDTKRCRMRLYRQGEWEGHTWRRPRTSFRTRCIARIYLREP